LEISSAKAFWDSSNISGTAVGTEFVFGALNAEFNDLTPIQMPIEFSGAKGAKNAPAMFHFSHFCPKLVDFFTNLISTKLI
jgi:hypothetical protein